MKDRPDAELISEAKSGSRAAFNEIVRRYQEKVYWVVRRLVDDPDDSLDIAQDVFVRVWRRIDQFRGDAQLYTWLYKIATNLSFNYLRKKKLRTFLKIDEFFDVAADSETSPDEQIERQETGTVIDAAIAKLPKKQRLVFMMRYYDELSYEEISKILNTSVGGLKANYFHALRKIEDHIKHAL